MGLAQICRRRENNATATTRTNTSHPMRIKSESSMWAGIMTLVAVLTIGFIGTYFYLMWVAGRATWFVYFFTAPFFLVGAGLGYWGVRGLIRRLLFGVWQLEVPRPGVLGNPMEVRLFPGRDVLPVGGIRCNLCCLLNSTINTGRSMSTNSKTLWEHSWVVTSPAIQRDTGLNLTLPLPARGSTTHSFSVGPSPNVKWQLTVNVPFRRGSDEPMFDIPIAGTP